MDNNWLKKLLKKLRLNEAAISTALGAVVVATVGVLIYNYFTGINKTAPETTPAEEKVALVEEAGQLVPENLPLKHTVAAGEDLWKISAKYFDSGYNWVDIAKANQLDDADRIETGQELTIPRVGVKLVTKAKVETKPVTIEADEYLVQKGDFLWKIAVMAYGDGYAWTKIWEANREAIADPNIIEPGTLIRLPR